MPRATASDADKGLSIKPEETLHATKPESSVIVFEDGHQPGSCQALLLIEVCEDLAVVAVRPKPLAGEPDVAGAVLVNTPNLLSVDNALLGEVRELLAVESTDPAVRRSKPDVSRPVFENAVNRVIA